MSDSATFKMAFTESEAFNMTFKAEETFATEMTEVVQVTTSDHRELTHRDAAEQHPIGAITNLSTELENRVVSGDTLTNEEIEKIIFGG